MGDLQWSEDHQLRSTAAERNHEVGQTGRSGDQARVQLLLIWHETGVTTCRSPGKNRDLIQFVGSRQQGCHEGMTDFVISDQSFFGTVLKGLGTEAHGDAFQGPFQLAIADEGLLFTGREDGCLVDQVGQLSTGETRCSASPCRQIDLGIQRSRSRMNAKNLLTAAAIRQRHVDAPIKASWTGEGCIQHISSVGGCQQNHPRIVGKTIHFREQLVQGLLPLVIPSTDSGTALTTDGVNLIDEHDAWGLLLRLTEQITDPTGPDPDKQLNEFGGGHRKERHLRFTGDGTGQECFSSARGTHEQHATGNLGAKTGERFRLLKEGDHLLELLLGVVDAGNVLKAHLKILLGLQPWLTAAETKGTVGHLGGSTQQERQPYHQEQDESKVPQQTGHGLFTADVSHRERCGRSLGGPEDLLIVNKNADGGFSSIGVGHPHFAACWNQFKRADITVADLFQQARVTDGLRFLSEQAR